MVEHGRAPAKATGPGFKARLRSGDLMLGLIVKAPAAAVIELAGHTGFDCVLIDAEHGPGGMLEIEDHVRAAEVAGITAMVRVPTIDGPEILRALDAGAEAIVVPHVRNAADVGRAVVAVHYPPIGDRSLAVSTRAGRQGTRSIGEHVEASLSRVALIAQIEDAGAVDAAAEIAAAPWLDGVFIGPADLSASLGMPGQLDAPPVAAAVEQIVTAVRRQQGPGLCVLASDDIEAAGWHSRGARLALFGAPALLASKMTDVVVRSRVPDPKEDQR